MIANVLTIALSLYVERYMLEFLSHLVCFRNLWNVNMKKNLYLCCLNLGFFGLTTSGVATGLLDGSLHRGPQAQGALGI